MRFLCIHQFICLNIHLLHRFVDRERGRRGSTLSYVKMRCKLESSDSAILQRQVRPPRRRPALQNASHQRGDWPGAQNEVMESDVEGQNTATDNGEVNIPWVTVFDHPNWSRIWSIYHIINQMSLQSLLPIYITPRKSHASVEPLCLPIWHHQIVSLFLVILSLKPPLKRKPSQLEMWPLTAMLLDGSSVL